MVDYLVQQASFMYLHTVKVHKQRWYAQVWTPDCGCIGSLVM